MTMSSTSTTPLVSRKVLPRSKCSVCGDFHSDSVERTVEMDISPNKQTGEGARRRPTLFNQCAKCLNKHGDLISVWHRPYEHDKGYFEKHPKEAVTLLGTGPTDD